MKDKVLGKLVKAEIKRQSRTLNLIASENYVSSEVLLALGSGLVNKYAEGYPGHRYYGGNKLVDQIENLCKERALKLFRLSAKKWSVNVQPLSGSPANLAVYHALVPIGGRIMGMSLSEGGHLTHGHKVSVTGKIWRWTHFGVDKKTERLDYRTIEKLAGKIKPRLIVAGFTAYSRIIDFKKLRKIADSCDAYLMIDMSHFAGLVAGGVYPLPFPYADVVTTTTHKTLRGPRAALIFSRNYKLPTTNYKLSEVIDRAVFPGLQGGPHLNQIAAVAVALAEAARPAFKKYARQVVVNAKTLAGGLARLGWRVVSGGTDSHLFLVDSWLDGRGLSGKEAADCLEKSGIIVNKNSIPFDARSPMDPSGFRVGTPALTSREMGPREMKKIGQIINKVLRQNLDVSREVAALCAKFPIKAYAHRY